MWLPFTEAWPHSATELEPLFTNCSTNYLPSRYGNIFNLLIPYGNNKKIWTSDVSSCKVSHKVVFYAYYLTTVNCYDSMASVINGALVGDTNRRKPQYWKKPAPVPICVSQIPHGLACDWTWAFAVTGQWLTTWVKAQPYIWLWWMCCINNSKWERFQDIWVLCSCLSLKANLQWSFSSVHSLLQYFTLM